MCDTWTSGHLQLGYASRVRVFVGIVLAASEGAWAEMNAASNSSFEDGSHALCDADTRAPKLAIATAGELSRECMNSAKCGHLTRLWPVDADLDDNAVHAVDSWRAGDELAARVGCE